MDWVDGEIVRSQSDPNRHKANLKSLTAAISCRSKGVLSFLSEAWEASGVETP